MTPGECPNEGAVADIGGGKSFCIPWDRWTNCREAGHCVYEGLGDAPEQMRLFEIEEEQ